MERERARRERERAREREGEERAAFATRKTPVVSLGNLRADVMVE